MTFKLCCVCPGKYRSKVLTFKFFLNSVQGEVKRGNSTLIEENVTVYRTQRLCFKRVE